LIDLVCIVLAGSLALAAAAIDVRASKIPNALTYPFILPGLFLLPLRCTQAVACLTLAVSCCLVYAIWKPGLWGGGDAKLVLALVLLVSPAYPPLLFLAALSLCLAIVLFIRHLMIGRGPGPMGPSLLLSYLLSVVAMWAFL
jgi:prepilin peptidase CpaA